MGIVVFHPEDESDLEVNAGLTIDIIAIHGLNGNQINTWTEPKSKKLWLRDFLPQDLRGARVMTFGYNATAAFENSVAGIQDHARDLLGALVEKRERSPEAKRPLIFIGHSLGGLVIKQKRALIIAEQESIYKNIYNNTLGIIFFGTPHQGSSFANYFTIVTRIVVALANKPNAELLESLRKDSSRLRHLADRWKEHHERRPYEIVSFYETRTMKGLRGLIVEKNSALLTPQGEVLTYEDQIPVDATHRDMCRFASPKDRTYKAVVRSFKRIQQKSRSQVKNEFYLVPHAVNPHFTGRNEIRERLNDSLILYQTPKVQQRFVLYGLGGSGKTQICLKFAEDSRENFWGIFWIDASSNETAQEGFSNLARACKQEENVESFKAWLSRKDHWLLILDNVDNPAMDVSKFFPLREGGTVLITTRNPDLQKHGTAGFCRVDQLCSKDAVTLLLRTAAVENLQDQNTRQVAEQIVNVLGCLALAIVQAGAVIRQGLCNLDGFCEMYLKQEREVLESGVSTSSIDPYQYSVFTTWEISTRKIEQMPDDYAKLALELLRLFSWMHFDGIREKMFQAARDNSTRVKDAVVFNNSLLAKYMPDGWNGLLWGKSIRLLVAFSLVTSHSGQLYMHPLVHLWSRDRMSEPLRAETWKTALVTLGISVTCNAADEQNRRLLLPHVDSVLKYDSGQLFAPGSDRVEKSIVTLNFHAAYLEGGQYQKALKIVQADLKSKEKLVEPRDENYLVLRCLVGGDLHRLGRFRESADWNESLMKDLADSRFHATILQTVAILGSSYNSLRRYQNSLDICNKTIAKFEKIIGGEAPAIRFLSNVIGGALSGLKRPAEALVWSKKGLLEAQKVYGAVHSNTFTAMECLAQDYANLKDFHRACDLQEQCVNRMRDTLGPDHPTTIESEERLVIFTSQRKMNFFLRKKVIGHRRALLEKMIKQFGERDWRTLDCQSRLAHDYFACASLKKSKHMQEKWVEIMIEEFGEDDERTIEGITTLARTQQWIAARKALYWWLPQHMLK